MSLREYNFQVFDQKSYTGFHISSTIHQTQKEVIAQVQYLSDLSHLHENSISINEEDKENIMMILEQLCEENQELLKLMQGDCGILLESTKHKYLH